MSGVDVLASRFRLALDRTCQYQVYQVMISNGLFEETNEQCIFSKVFYNQFPFKFPVYNLH